MTDNAEALTGTVLDENIHLSLRELCRACQVNAEYILELVDEGVVEPHGASPRDWHFTGTAVKRIQITLHLQRDLRVNLSGAALALDLLEQLETLRQLRRVDFNI